MRSLYFTARTERPNRLGPCDVLRRYADEQRVAAYLTLEQAAEPVLDCFKRAARQELQLLELRCHGIPPTG